MIRNFGIVLLALFSADASASWDFYQELLNTFEKASLPAVSDLKGWFSGRCYFENKRVTPMPALFLSYEQRVEDDHGPLFLERKVFKFHGLTAQNSDAGLYDLLTDPKEKEIEQAVAREKKFVTPAIVKDASLFEQWPNLKVEWRVRKARHHILLKASRNGEPFGVCYFFSKVK